MSDSLVEQRQQRRLRMLQRIYEASGGSTTKWLPVSELAQAAEIGEQEANDILDHLEGLGMIWMPDQRVYVKIKDQGIKEYERLRMPSQQQVDQTNIPHIEGNAQMDITSKANISERRKNRNLLMIEVYREANGGKLMRVPLWDIAQKLGINEDEATNIYSYYQDKGFFDDAAGSRVALSHYGIVSIERSVLESKEPSDLVATIQKKQELRFLLLRKVFDRSGGSSQEAVNFNDLAKEEGVNDNDSSDFLDYLADEHLIKVETFGGWVSITSDGIQEIEEWMEAQSNDKRARQSDPQPINAYRDNVIAPPKLKVFLCHSSRNKQAVRDLYDRLKADGIEPWLDEKNILVGQKWELEIKKAVRSSDAIIVCLSKDALDNSGYFHKEIKLVLDVADEQPDDHIFVMPILLEECEVPERFRELHCLDYQSPSAYEILLYSLQARAKQIERSKEQAIQPEYSQEKLSEDAQDEAVAKVSEWLKRRNIEFKGEWISYEDIAADTNLEIAIIKECIEYAAFLQHLKVEMRNLGSAYIRMAFGSSF